MPASTSVCTMRSRPASVNTLFQPDTQNMTPATIRASSSRDASTPRRGDGTANRQRKDGMATPEVEEIHRSVPAGSLLADEAGQSEHDNPLS
ncbi:hypothetical protein G6F31_020870 [Rhizopus arrhizus]|nr:hypothetical protein G6F31_020870 [Rhizopus arrhizus]